jgi:membrane protease YdiL (CAAX protease family)
VQAPVVTTTTALIVTLLLMVAVNVWVHVGPRRAHPVTGPVAAAVLLLLGRAAGLSWAELGLGREALGRGLVWGGITAAVVAIGYAVGVAVPATHRLFQDTRYRVGMGSALAMAFVRIPLSTVVFEEVAFRGVLWGLIAVGHGPGWATGVTAVLFGLWHVLPALDLLKTNDTLRGGSPSGRRLVTVLGTVLGTVAFTMLAGVVFGELRHRTGSLLGPMLLHWATNGLAVIATARVWAVSRG